MHVAVRSGTAIRDRNEIKGGATHDGPIDMNYFSYIISKSTLNYYYFI